MFKFQWYLNQQDRKVLLTSMKGRMTKKNKNGHEIFAKIWVLIRQNRIKTGETRSKG